MVYRDLVVLIPSHGLEDFPTELTEQQAAGLLNAFSVIWHPALLNRCDSLPSWHRADDPPHQRHQRGADAERVDGKHANGQQRQKYVAHDDIDAGPAADMRRGADFEVFLETHHGSNLPPAAF